jgi:hypothetical protein
MHLPTTKNYYNQIPQVNLDKGLCEAISDRPRLRHRLVEGKQHGFLEPITQYYAHNLSVGS